VARLKSDDKRTAIMEAAVAEFAERGLAATPTAAISRAAGIAEGTLFTYFPTRAALLNELYRALKRELADVILQGMPDEADAHACVRHVWQRYVSWGVAHAARLRVIAQLRVSDQLTPESVALANAPFAGVERLVADGVRRGQLRVLPSDYLAAALEALAETSIAFAARTGGEAYVDVGFELFWGGIATRS
jgi:AcrR family transcriptional regulator